MTFSIHGMKKRDREVIELILLHQILIVLSSCDLKKSIGKGKNSKRKSKVNQNRSPIIPTWSVPLSHQSQHMQRFIDTL